MAWVVDTCILIDILEDDPRFGEASARLVDRHAAQGLIVCPVTYAELAPAFGGNLTLQNEFLEGIGVNCREDWSWQDTLSVSRRSSGIFASTQRWRPDSSITRTLGNH